MRYAITAGALALAVGLGAPHTPALRADEKPDVATMFKARCAGCHAVPDVGLRTDRAWLDQVKRTA
jgi:uncharacterized membrane protein